MVFNGDPLNAARGDCQFFLFLFFLWENRRGEGGEEKGREHGVTVDGNK